MKTRAAWGGLALILLMVTSCATRQERYLDRSVNQASQDAVAKEFGPPTQSQELTTGETVWGYRSNQGSRCKEYILTFDRQKVLRAWKEQKC